MNENEWMKEEKEANDYIQLSCLTLHFQHVYKTELITLLLSIR